MSDREKEERVIDLGDGAEARIGDCYVALITPTDDFVLTINQARRLAAELAQKIMKN